MRCGLGFRMETHVEAQVKGENTHMQAHKDAERREPFVLPSCCLHLLFVSPVFSIHDSFSVHRKAGKHGDSSSSSLSDPLRHVTASDREKRGHRYTGHSGSWHQSQSRRRSCFPVVVRINMRRGRDDVVPKGDEERVKSLQAESPSIASI